MEAMTQEFMLHRRPHVEIWSAREGSDDDNDSLQRQPWTLKGSISETKSLMDPNQQTQTNQKTRSISETKKSDGSSIPITPNFKPWEHKWTTSETTSDGS